MITFCTTGDFLIHIPIPEGHAGAAAIAAEMKTAAQNLEFEYAAELRDRIIRLQDKKEPGKGRRRGKK